MTTTSKARMNKDIRRAFFNGRKEEILNAIGTGEPICIGMPKKQRKVTLKRIG